MGWDGGLHMLKVSAEVNHFDIVLVCELILVYTEDFSYTISTRAGVGYYLSTP